jgi:O-antigen/teichoic acid export membrane protein
VAFYALTLAIQAALMGLESFKGVALSQLVQGTAAGAGLVLGASEHGALGALIGFSVGQALAAAAAFLLLHHALAARSLAVSYRLERAVLRPLWRLGVPTFIAFVTVSSAILAGQVLLSHQHRGYEQVAIFTAAYRWHLAILFVPAAVAPLLVPVMTRLAAAARGPRLRSLFQRSVAGTLLLAAVPALVVALAAPLVLGLSGDFYAHHSLPLVLLAAAAIPAALNNVLSGTSVSLGAVRAWLVSDVVLALVLVGAGALLIASMQASGLALAYLGAYVATDAVLAVPLVRRLRPAGTPT